MQNLRALVTRHRDDESGMALVAVISLVAIMMLIVATALSASISGFRGVDQRPEQHGSDRRRVRRGAGLPRPRQYRLDLPAVRQPDGSVLRVERRADQPCRPRRTPHSASVTTGTWATVPGNSGGLLPLRGRRDPVRIRRHHPGPFDRQGRHSHGQRGGDAQAEGVHQLPLLHGLRDPGPADDGHECELRGVPVGRPRHERLLDDPVRAGRRPQRPRALERHADRLQRDLQLPGHHGQPELADREHALAAAAAPARTTRRTRTARRARSTRPSCRCPRRTTPCRRRPTATPRRRPAASTRARRRSP